MTAVFKHARKEAPEGARRRLAPAPDGARRCLVTGEMKPRAELIRFVIGPEDAVVPDLSENLPGRGLWVMATADAVGLAARKNLFAKAARVHARPSRTLAEDVVLLLRQRCLQFLGLAKGAGIAVLGETQTEAALRANKLALYLHAPDAGRALDNRNSIAECGIFLREEMGAALGYDQIAYAGFAPHGITEKLKLEIKRLQFMTLSSSDDKNEG
jgi:predicted RNA-binding protein YlxR (DUF448 family)